MPPIQVLLVPCIYFKYQIRALDENGYLVIIEGIFLFSVIESICCDPSSELSCRDGSDEGSPHMFLCRIKKNPQLSSITPSYLELCQMAAMFKHHMKKLDLKRIIVHALRYCFLTIPIICINIMYDYVQHIFYARMDELLTCNFPSFSTVYQSYQDGRRVLRKGCLH